MREVSGGGGLSSAEARKRLARYGLNELKTSKSTGPAILLRQFTNPFVWILLAAAGLSVALSQFVDGCLILGFVSINASLGFFQEFRGERALRKLEKLLTTHVRVYRDGQVVELPSAELVIGDVIEIKIGDLVPADAELIETQSLTVDESRLTGESLPASKTKGDTVASQTAVVSGTGRARVTATGEQSRLGQIAHLTSRIGRISNFALRLRTFSRFTIVMVVLALALLIPVKYLNGNVESWNEFLIFAIALSISVIPEALPLVTTLAQADGAVHLARQNVVVKRLSAIEDLGSLEILCTDKTGTLTENAMMYAGGYGHDFEIKLTAALGSEAGQGERAHGVFDAAIQRVLSTEQKAELVKAKRLSAQPFDPNTRLNTVELLHGREHLTIVRGAPEEVLEKCGLSVSKMPDFKAWLVAQGRDGRRILALAERVGSAHAFHFVGAMAFADPLKKTAKSALAAAHELGIEVKIISGDSPEVTGAIAHEAGLITHPSQVLTGSQLARLKGAAKLKRVRSTAVFARISPEQKQEIITLLRKHAVVGFLGEGINDAPALKAADVGIVVREASDIARSAADIILLKRSLGTVVDGIQGGRRVCANTVKYVRATIASNFGNFYAMIAATVLVPFLPMTAVQILLVNLLTDFPMLSIATDSVDQAELETPSRYNLHQIVVVATLLGLVSTVFDLIIFGHYAGQGPNRLHTYWFVGSVLTELVFLYSVRTRGLFIRASRPSGLLVALTLLAGVVAILLPMTSLGGLLGLVPLSKVGLMTLGSIVCAYFIASESVKWVYFKMQRV